MALAACNAAEMLGVLMLGLGKIATARDSATVSPARSQEIYQRYAVELYRQALLNPDDPAPAGHVARDALVNECALAAMPERGEDSAPHDRSGKGALGLALFSGLGYIRLNTVRGIRPGEMAALVRAVLRKLTTSPPAPAKDSDQV
jgi:hypothetical protein